MGEGFIEKLNQKHLCTFFILPLLKLNIDCFGGDVNFINSFLIQNSQKIAVLVADASLCWGVTADDSFLYLFTENQNDYLVFEVPKKWTADYEAFLDGAYSKMSDKAKNFIRGFSGLNYREYDIHGRPITDSRLMALDLNPVLKNKWAEVLGVKSTDYIRPSLDLSGELLSKPSASSFIRITAI